jgi:small subunit ribosomal protein S20
MGCKFYECNLNNKMANHKSAQKRIRSNDKKRLRNKYQHKTARNAVRKLRSLTDKKEATSLLPLVASMLDKLAKKNIIHKKKAANLKSGLTVAVNKL